MSTWQVGINAHLLSRQAGYRSAGIHGYIYNLLRCLPAVDRVGTTEGVGSRVSEQNGPLSDLPRLLLHYTIFLGKGRITPDERLTIARSAWPTGRPIVRLLWEQLALPWAKMDLLHSMAFVAPLVSPWPTVVTVYDLSFIHYPAAFPTSQRVYLRLFTQLSCRRARRVIAISQSTRRDLVKQWGLPAGKIDVAYPGVGVQFRPLPADEVAAFRARRGLPERFILHLGTLQPRKNLVRLVRAYGRLCAHGTDAKLVLVGGRGWFYQEILAEIERLNLQNDVLLPGYAPAEELPLWYNAAALLAYPSLYEGFGLPVVEAMACGTPVVTSNVSSMPEAAGDAALLVNPHDTAALADALHCLLADGGLPAKGREQAAGFTWHKTAADTVATYQRALGETK